MYKTKNRTHTGWNRMLCLLLVLLANMAHAQQGSWGNTMIHGGGQIAVFGAHSFVTGGTGTQPGIIKTERSAPIGIFRFATTATYTGESNASHIDGYVSKTGTSAFVFPVGNGTKIRKIGISAPTANGTFRAAYWLANPNTATLPTGAPFPVANRGTGVTGVSTTEFWDLNGPTSVNVTLTWDAASNLNTLAGGNSANLIVVGYNTSTSKWESLGNAGGSTGTLTGTGSITANGVTPSNYSAITFGTSAPVVPDLKPLITMLDRSFVKPTAMQKPLTIRIGNLVASTATSGSYDVYLSVGSGFTAALNGVVAGWTLTDLGAGDYQLSSSVVVTGGTAASIPLNLSAKPTASKGTYNLSVTIDNNAGGETNNTNNNVSADVSVSL